MGVAKETRGKCVRSIQYFQVVLLVAGVAMSEGRCVKDIEVTVDNIKRSVGYGLVIEDTPNCTKRDSWRAEMRPCLPNNESFTGSGTEYTVFREGGSIRLTLSGVIEAWRRVVVVDGTTEVPSRCFAILGMRFKRTIYVEYNFNKLLFRLNAIGDPRVKNIYFKVYQEYPGGDCDRTTSPPLMVLESERDGSIFTASHPGPFNESTCLCFSYKLEWYGRQLQYDTKILHKCTPHDPGKTLPKKKYWVGGAIGGGLVVGVVVIIGVVVSIKKWRPFSAHSLKNDEFLTETSEVFVLYTPDQANRRTVRDLLSNLSAHNWKVTDLNDYSMERLQDETSWIERLAGGSDKEVKVVVVDCPALHSLYASILNTDVNEELDHDQSFLRFAVRQILIEGHYKYDRMFVVRFSEDIPENEDPPPGAASLSVPVGEEQREGRLMVGDRKYILPEHYGLLLAGLKGRKEEEKEEERDAREEGCMVEMNEMVLTSDPVMV